MIILGVILLVLGFLLAIPILWTIGIIVLVIGLVLLLLGSMGRAVAGRLPRSGGPGRRDRAPLKALFPMASDIRQQT